MTRDTKKELYTAFLSLLDTEPYGSISVTEIVSACQVHRNTFYYHFRDKDDLVLQLLRDETEKVLSEQNASSSLSENIRRALSFLREHEHSVRKLYSGVDISLLDAYFHDVLLHQLSLYLRKLTEGREISSSEVLTIAKAGTYVIEGCIFHYLQSGDDFVSDLEDYLKELENVAQGTLSLMLDRIDARNRQAAASAHHSIY